jgi:hypothetical protein
LQHELDQRELTFNSVPVGRTPYQNQERPEAIHAGESCSGIDIQGELPMLDLPALEEDQTATPGSSGSYA